MTRFHPWLAGVVCLAGIATLCFAQDAKPKADPAAIAKQILDDATPADRRTALVNEHPAIAPELIAAMTADLKPGAEEYRRIPWIWRVAIATGRRNDADQLRRLLDVSLPRPGEPLRDWQAVVLGGGLINGISLEKKWPGERFNELLKGDDALTRRWSAALADAHRMADAEKVPTGTRYDALRMIALDSWDKCGQRLTGYLKKGTHSELQMGAISGLSDIDRPEAAALLADGLTHFPAANRKLALDALLRTDARKAVLKARLEKGELDRAWLDEKQHEAMEPKPELTPEERKELLSRAKSINDDALRLFQEGKTVESEKKLRELLKMFEMLYPVATHPNGHPNFAHGLQNMGMVLLASGQGERAVSILQQCFEMRRRLYPPATNPSGHPSILRCLVELGTALQVVGKSEQAVAVLQDALRMLERLYPIEEHPMRLYNLVQILSRLGSAMLSLGDAKAAVGYFERSLAIRKNIFPQSKYPDGHIDIADNLNQLALAFREQGQIQEALAKTRASLNMVRALFPVAKFPKGHPFIAGTLSNLGDILCDLERYDEAMVSLRQCLDMARQLFPQELYPDGHPYLAVLTSNLGRVHHRLGHTEPAAIHAGLCLEMHRRILKREMSFGTEEAMFDLVSAQPLFRDVYLSVTRNTSSTPDEILVNLWPLRSMISRLIDQRQANIRAAGTELGDQIGNLRGLRRRVDQLLQDTKMKPDDRDKLLVAVTQERDKLERELLVKMPTLQRWQELDKLGPADLVKALPPGAVFVDVIRYTHFEYVDKKQKRTPSYVAFVVASGGRESGRESPDGATNQGASNQGASNQGTDVPRSPGIVRVELGEAAPIDSAITTWRTAIDSGRDVRGFGTGTVSPKEKEVGDAIELLSQRIWRALAKHLPTGTKTLYLAPDGDLARLPWAALPVGGGQVLLEKYAIAQVPHGLFLLDQLKNAKKREASDSLLTLGAVDYGMSPWPALPGTAKEAQAIAALAPGQKETLAEKDATADRLKALLPKARLLHLATHGEFKATAFAQEQERARKARESAQLGDGPRGIGAKNPLGYVGIVLAGGEVLSGFQIVDLHLENVHLVTLSACETGLGALTGGEGVQGLQRAFHLAGCPNVVASLWKVNDAATAALMAKFYHEMWVNKKPPIEALREAQLTIYRHPELIPDLAGERGAVRVKEAVGVRAGEPSGVSRQFSDTKLWAAFILSGVGR